MNTAPIEAIFFIDVVTAAAAVLLLLFFLKTPSHARAREQQETSYFKDMREGVLYIKEHTYVRKFFVFCAFFFFLVSPGCLPEPASGSKEFR